MPITSGAVKNPLLQKFSKAVNQIFIIGPNDAVKNLLEEVL